MSNQELENLRLENQKLKDDFKHICTLIDKTGQVTTLEGVETAITMSAVAMQMCTEVIAAQRKVLDDDTVMLNTFHKCMIKASNIIAVLMSSKRELYEDEKKFALELARQITIDANQQISPSPQPQASS